MGKNWYYCRINGTMHNLKKIQEVIDKNPENPDMGEIYLLSIEEYGLPEDNMLVEVIEFNNNEIPGDYNEKLEELRRDNPSKFPSKPKPYCRINGTVYNLKKVQEVIDRSPEKLNMGEIFLLSIEEYGLPENNMLDDVIKFNNNKIPFDYNEKLKEWQDYNQSRHPPIPRCPRCSSANIYKLGFLDKASSPLDPLEVAMGLPFDGTWKCNNCGHIW